MDCRPESCLNILQITSGREVNGALVHVELLTRELRALGHNVSIVCRPDFWLWDRLSDNASFDVHGSDLSRWPLRELNRIAQLVRDRRIDVIHTHQSRAHMFGLLLRWKTGVPVVATAHNRYMQIHWRLNDFVIANSEATRRFQTRVNRVPPHRIETAHCFVDLERFKTAKETRVDTRRGLGIHDRRPLLGVIGEVTPRKGHVHLFRALPEIVRQFPNAKLALLGRYHRSERCTRQLRKILYDNQLFNRVIWIGRRDNVQDFMGAMDVCIVPSVEEPLGMVAIEALAAGTPCVVTDSGGLPEIIRHGENGLMVPRKNPPALAKAVCQLLSDPAGYRQLVQNGRRTVAEQFSPRTLTNKIVNIFERVIKSGNASKERHHRAA